MRQRNPIAVFFLTFITLGIYGIVWQVKTKNDMNNLGAQIPTAWWLIVPLVNIWWLWKYSEGVEKVTNGGVSAILAFVLQFLLGVIGSVILQFEFNKLTGAAAPVVAGQPSTNPLPTSSEPQADNSFGGPTVTSTEPQSTVADTTPTEQPPAPQV